MAVSRRLHDVGHFGTVAVKKTFISKKVRQPNVRLHYCVKIGLKEIGQKCFSWMSKSSTFFRVMGGNIYEGLNVKNTIANRRFLQ